MGPQYNFNVIDGEGDCEGSEYQTEEGKKDDYTWDENHDMYVL